MSIKKIGNDSGFSLMELLVALAVSSLVIIATMTLLTNGINNYRRQTVTAQLQEDADLALTHISDALFEAKYIDIGVSASAPRNTTMFYIEKEQKYGYKYDGTTKTLSVVTSDGTTTVDSVLCSNVNIFKVQLLDESFNIQGEGDEAKLVSINDTVQVKVTIEVEDNDITRKGARVIGLRNTMDIKDIVILGFDADKGLGKEELIEAGVLVTE